MLDLFEQPIFSAYLKMVQLPDEVKKQNGIKVGASVPRFDLVAVSGYFAPLESVKSERDGHIHFYLTNGGDGVDCKRERKAETKLQDNKNGNFSSVYIEDITPVDGYFVGYGNPNKHSTYSKSKKTTPNPYCKNGDDGFLFLIKEDWSEIEVFVVPKNNGGNGIKESVSRAYRNGKYKETIKTMRETAKVFHTYKGQKCKVL